MTQLRGTGSKDLEAFYADLRDKDLQALWTLEDLLTAEPRPRVLPHRWSGSDLRDLAQRAGELVPLGQGGERRVLSLSNPGLAGAPFATTTLWVAIQYLGAQEVAPAHRHTPGALRFVTEGEGAATLVDGDVIEMAKGDLVLTPSWMWHEHQNPAHAPMTWLDVLDLPIVQALEAIFFEPGVGQGPTANGAPSASERTFGIGAGLLPVNYPAPGRHSPLLVYRWKNTDAALEALLTNALPSVTHAGIRFTNPQTGQDVMPTIRCEMHRYRAMHAGQVHRRTGSSVITVLAGEGTICVGSEAYDVEAGDVVAVPSWSALRVTTTEPLDVFVVSDGPIMEALGLDRTQTE